MAKVDEQTVRLLAAIADLEIDEEDMPSVVEVFGAWLPEANELNRKMSSAEHWQITPATVFAHPTSAEETP